MRGRLKPKPWDEYPPYPSFATVEDLGKLIRAHRRARGYTLELAAGLAGISARLFSELERGRETVEIGRVLKAVDALGMNLCAMTKAEGRKRNGLINLKLREAGKQLHATEE